MKSASVILFDGICNLCSASVQWIIKHDKNAVFKFASLQSETGIEFKRKYAIPEKMDSVILIENNKVYFKSTAALKIAGKCSGIWKILYACLILPKFIRDAIYDIIARKRYNWFGKKEMCWMPDPELSKRFI